MLEQKTFLQGLNYLKANYINWSFDLTNDLAIAIWYKKFSNLDATTFMQLIELYTEKSKFAPNSPADILNLVPVDLTPSDAWETIYAVIKRAFNNSNFLSIMAKEQPALYPFVQFWDIEQVQNDDANKDSLGNVCWSYILGRPFKREYEAHLRSKKLVRLGGGSVRLIEG